jgi:hypothetical protein
MELFFFRFFRKAAARWSWQIGYTSARDSRPKIEYYCPFCKNVNGSQAWVSNSKDGFAGRAPVARCCAQAIPYPVDNDEYLAHLTAKPRFADSEQVGVPAFGPGGSHIVRQSLLDLDAIGSTGEYKYDGTGSKGQLEFL